MDGFLGIDIGTKNSKALLLDESGNIVHMWKQTTPHILKDSHYYFDITNIEAYTDYWIEEAKSICRLRSVGFSSIGESVVPIKSGKAISMPLVWYERTDYVAEEKKEILHRWAGFEYTGVHRTPTFSAYKMLWMLENVLSELPDLWLPISSYLIYRKTGIARWDTSQAGRSYLYNIHKKEWNLDVAEQLRLRLPEKVGSLGDYCGCCDGIVYGLGGHDHYVGLYAVRKLYGSSNLFYDSMGSSSVLAVVKADEEKKQRGVATYNPKGGCLVTGFQPEEYVINRALDYYGRVLESLMNLSGRKADKLLYDAVNGELLHLPESERLCMFACPKDYGKYADLAQDMNLLKVKENSSFPELILSGYLYMVLGTDNMYQELSRYCNGSQNEMPYFTGGGITDNKLFMQLKAAALNRELTILKTSEISSLGAAISGLCACGEGKRLGKMKEVLLEGEKVIPQMQYVEYIAEMKKRYESG